MSTSRHDATESWTLDFVSHTGDVGGFVRLARVGARCWYWCYLVGSELGLVAVRDHDVAPPRRPTLLEIRADALWAELVCETPGEHWTFGVEAFGVRLDAPIDAWTNEIGARVAVGLDVEWEVADVGPPFGSVHGDVLLERDRHALDAWGVFEHAAGSSVPWPDRWAGWCRFTEVGRAGDRWARVVGGSIRRGADGIGLPETLELADGTTWAAGVRGVVPVPLDPGTERGPALVRVLIELLPGPGPLGGSPGEAAPGAAVAGVGWVQVLQS